MLTPKGFLVSDLHFWISLRRSAGVGKMRAVMMPRPPALETALANSAYPTYWKKSPESVFYRVSMAVRPLDDSHPIENRRHVISVSMSRPMETPKTAKGQLADPGHVPSYRPARRALWFSSVNYRQGSVCVSSWVRPSRVAYSPRMPKRRVSSVFHGMVLVLSASEKESEEGSQGLCCSFRWCGNL